MAIKTDELQSQSESVYQAKRYWFSHIRWSRIISYALLSIGSFFMIIPFFWMIGTAFKLPQEVIAYPPVWIPSHPTFDAFFRLFTQFHFGTYILNSVTVVVIVVISVTLTCALVGFVLAKYQFVGREVVFFLIIITMMIPWPTLLIPQYWIVLKLDWLNSYKALIVPGIFSTFGIFLVRQYMHAVPDELLDAGRIDGANEPMVFMRIVLPLVLPALAAVAILTFLWTWDSFIWPLVVTNSTEMYTLPIGLQLFVGQHSTDYVSMNAGSSIAVIPVLVIFLLAQRHFIEGITMSGMKG